MDMEAVLLTGLYGVGKSTIAAEMADLLEDAGLPYAALDLDWLTWCNAGDGDSRRAEERMRHRPPLSSEGNGPDFVRLALHRSGYGRRRCRRACTP
jgi:Adenylylsulphate kinase